MTTRIWNETQDKLILALKALSLLLEASHGKTAYNMGFCLLDPRCTRCYSCTNNEPQDRDDAAGRGGDKEG